MQTRQVVLPAEVLPGVLDSNHAAVRGLLVPLLGERGRWLCRQNPDWSHFLASQVVEGDVDLESLKETWEHGAIDERCRTLVALRRRDPRTARDWVGQVFSKEKPNHRVRLVECFKTSLCEDDESFLEPCLSDRSALVGQAAALLLRGCRIPRWPGGCAPGPRRSWSLNTQVFWSSRAGWCANLLKRSTASGSVTASANKPPPGRGLEPSGRSGCLRQCHLALAEPIRAGAASTYCRRCRRPVCRVGDRRLDGGRGHLCRGRPRVRRVD